MANLFASVEAAEQEHEFSYIDQNYIWWYFDENSPNAFQMAFGDYVELEGKTYREFGIVRNGQREKRGSNEVTWNDDDSKTWPKWLMREEDNCLYAIVPEENRNEWLLYDLSGIFNIAPEDFNWEIPVYNFNIEAGEFAYIYDIMGCYINFEITDVELLKVGDSYRKVFITRNWGYGHPDTYYKIIEGIGLNQGGCLAYATFVRPASYPIDPYYDSSWEHLILYEVTDVDGNPVYKNPNPWLSDCRTIADDDDQENKFEKTYDLFGREVSDPQPGTVYIRGGKKFVAG